MPIVRKPTSKSVKDLFPSIETEQAIDQKSQEDSNIKNSPDNIIISPKELPPHDNKKTILSTDDSIGRNTSVDRAGDISEQISTTNRSKETLDISNLDPTETLDEF